NARTWGFDGVLIAALSLPPAREMASRVRPANGIRRTNLDPAVGCTLSAGRVEGVSLVRPTICGGALKGNQVGYPVPNGGVPISLMGTVRGRATSFETGGLLRGTKFGRKQTRLACSERGVAPRFDAELGEGVGNVMLDRADADEKRL